MLGEFGPSRARALCVKWVSMIRTVLLKFGPKGHSEGLELVPSAMTVFIGANNVGKSLALRELTAYCKMGRREGQRVIDLLEFTIPKAEDVRALLRELEVPIRENESLAEGQFRVSHIVPSKGRADVTNVSWRDFFPALERWEEQQASGTLDWRKEVHSWFFTWYVSLFSLSLDGRQRLSLSDELQKGDLLGKATNHLAALFVDDKARMKLREIIYDAFGLYFVVDPTNGDMLRVRLSEKPPSNSAEEQSLNKEARAFHKQAQEISSFSDGVRAFCGLMAALISSEFRIILVDEPDAFLHPTLGRKLGKAMVRIASEREGNVFTSTHSAAFLMGCMESGQARQRCTPHLRQA